MAGQEKEQLTGDKFPLKTIQVTLKISAKDVPSMFDAEASAYMYDPRIEHGQWVSSRDELYHQWTQTRGELVLKLFEIGSLPVCGLRAAAEQGIDMPYWRKRLSKLEGWIVCQAQIVQVEEKIWHIEKQRVFYSLDGESDSMLISIPMTIRRTAINLLLDHNPSWFTFSQRTPDECVLDVEPSRRDWLREQVEAIKESGLDDDDDENAWFRYKGILISYVGDRRYWYRIWTLAMEEEKEFDVRDLELWDGEEAHIEQVIKAAIDSGELSPDAEFLHDCLYDQ